MTLTSFQPLYGKLSDIFGRKPALLFAYTIFGLGCLACGLARNLEELVAARAFAGMSFLLGLWTLGMADTFRYWRRWNDNCSEHSDERYCTSERKRNMARLHESCLRRRSFCWCSIGRTSSRFNRMALVRPLFFLHFTYLRIFRAFLGQAPVCLLAILVVYVILELPPTTTDRWWSKLKQVDFFGASSLIIAVSALLVGLDRGSNISWTSTLTIVCCVTSLPLFGLFILVEMKVASHPFAPGHIIFTPTLFAAYIANFFNLGGYMATMFYVPLYLQVVGQLSATQAGLRLIAPMICSVSGSLFGGMMMQRTGRYYWLTLGCLCASVTGSVTVMLSSRFLDSDWVILTGLSILSFGGGAVVTTLLISVIANAAAADQAMATACTYLFRSLGSVVGVSIGSTIVQQSLKGLLRERLDGDKAEWIVEGVRKSLDFIETLDKETRDVVIGCYKSAVSSAFGLTLGFVISALISAAWIKEKKLNK